MLNVYGSKKQFVSDGSCLRLMGYKKMVESLRNTVVMMEKIEKKRQMQRTPHGYRHLESTGGCSPSIFIFGSMDYGL